MKLPLDYDPATTVRRTWHIDNVDPRKCVVETTQDVQRYYEANQKIRSMGSKLEIPDWGCAVGDIPIADYMQLCKDFPDLKARGKGSREVREKALQKILATHPKRHCWMWQDNPNFFGKKRKT